MSRTRDPHMWMSVEKENAMRGKTNGDYLETTCFCAKAKKYHIEMLNFRR